MFKRFLPVGILGLLVFSLAMAACGDSPTAVPAAATPAVTTAVMAPAATTATTSSGTAAAAAVVPTYSGATSVTLPDAVKNDPGDLAKKLKNMTFTAFTTSDDPGKVKASFLSSFPGGGWSDITAQEFPASATQQLTTMGVTPLAFQKGNQTATVTIYTGGDVTKAMGFPDVTTGSTLYLVVSGNNN
jgi:hypothetical protein